MDSGEFYYPFAIVVDRVSGFVYVSEPYNERVQIFDSNGNYVYSFGSWNVPSSVLVARDFAYVMGLAAHNNQLFVSTGNLGNSRIVVFNMTLP